MDISNELAKLLFIFRDNFHQTFRKTTDARLQKWVYQMTYHICLFRICLKNKGMTVFRSISSLRYCKMFYTAKVWNHRYISVVKSFCVGFWSVRFRVSLRLMWLAEHTLNFIWFYNWSVKWTTEYVQDVLYVLVCVYVLGYDTLSEILLQCNIHSQKYSAYVFDRCQYLFKSINSLQFASHSDLTHWQKLQIYDR